MRRRWRVWRESLLRVIVVRACCCCLRAASALRLFAGRQQEEADQTDTNCFRVHSKQSARERPTSRRPLSAVGRLFGGTLRARQIDCVRPLLRAPLRTATGRLSWTLLGNSILGLFWVVLSAGPAARRALRTSWRPAGRVESGPAGWRLPLPLSLPLGRVTLALVFLARARQKGPPTVPFC